MLHESKTLNRRYVSRRRDLTLQDPSSGAGRRLQVLDKSCFQDGARKEGTLDLRALESVTRLLTCPVWKLPKETAHMQLRTFEGYRDLHCVGCGHHGRCGWHQCQCCIEWSRCDVHRTDPPQHRSHKAGTKVAAETRDSAESTREVKPKLSGKRPAP